MKAHTAPAALFCEAVTSAMVMDTFVAVSEAVTQAYTPPPQSLSVREKNNQGQPSDMARVHLEDKEVESTKRPHSPVPTVLLTTETFCNDSCALVTQTHAISTCKPPPPALVVVPAKQQSGCGGGGALRDLQLLHTWHVPQSVHKKRAVEPGTVIAVDSRAS